MTDLQEKIFFGVIVGAVGAIISLCFDVATYTPGKSTGLNLGTKVFGLIEIICIIGLVLSWGIDIFTKGNKRP